jgi:hypothetical protein
MRIIQIGNVQIDSGLLQLGDPAYFVENYDLSPVVGERAVQNEVWNKNAAREIVRQSVVEIFTGKAGCVAMPFPDTKGTVNAAGEPGLGVVAGGFGGDGLYPVYGICGDKKNPDLISGIFVNFNADTDMKFSELLEGSAVIVDGEILSKVSFCELPAPDLSL